MFDPRIAIYVGAVAAVFAAGWIVNGMRWQNKWDAREIQYQAAVIKAKDAAAAQLKREQALYDDAAADFQTEMERLAALTRRPPRTIRVCPSPAGVSAAGTSAPAAGTDGGADLRGPTGADAGAVLNADAVIRVGRTCDAQVRGLQGLLR